MPRRSAGVPRHGHADAGAGPRSSSRTGCRPCGTLTRSWCSTRAGSWSAGGSTTSSRTAGGSPSWWRRSWLGRRRSARRSRERRSVRMLADRVLACLFTLASARLVCAIRLCTRGYHARMVVPCALDSQGVGVPGRRESAPLRSHIPFLGVAVRYLRPGTTPSRWPIDDRRIETGVDGG